MRAAVSSTEVPTRAWDIDETAPGLAFGYLFAEDHQKYGTDKDAFIYVIVNAHWEEHDFEIPSIPSGFNWHLVAEANGGAHETGKEPLLENQSVFRLGPRSSAVLLAK